MELSKKIYANEVEEILFNAGDVIVIQKKRVGDPYMQLIITPVFYLGGHVVWSSYPHRVSLYNHRVFTGELEDPKREPMDMRLATKEERDNFFKAISDSCLDGLFHSVPEELRAKLAWNK